VDALSYNFVLAMSTSTDFDVIVVGAGFGGLYAIHKLRSLGFSVKAFEAGSDVGGTWFWNRYPGCSCDVESIHYSYQFDRDLQQDWVWTERYATQPEILSYINHVADRFDLRRNILFETRVTAATFIEVKGASARSHWHVETDGGKSYTARFCIMATGCLSTPNLPDIEGRDSFKGAAYHTGQWPHEGVDFSGLRVGVIGTGSSGIQSIPFFAEQASHVTVFQRTPNYAIPASNRPLTPDELANVKAHYKELRAAAKKGHTAIPLKPAGPSALALSDEERNLVYEDWWQTSGLLFQGTFADLLLDKNANQTASDFVRGKIHDIVADQRVADLLTPKTPLGCKRLCVDTDYYNTYNRHNVSLVDVSEDPIDCIEPAGIRVGNKMYEFEAIVFATGYDAITGALISMDIKGRDGRTLENKWAEGPTTYLGLSMHGFPNLFTINGPGSPSVRVNMVTGIEQHVEWIGDCLVHVRDSAIDTIEANAEDEQAWFSHNNEIASNSIWSSCGSWYSGANVPGKPRVFMPYVGGFPAYIEKCEQVVQDGYAGFTLT